MHKIYKFAVDISREFEIIMPQGSVILDVQTQQQLPYMWAAVPKGEVVGEEVQKETRKFTVVGTGHNLHALEDKKFIGTFQMAGGSFIGHLFELI